MILEGLGVRMALKEYSGHNLDATRKREGLCPMPMHSDLVDRMAAQEIDMPTHETMPAWANLVVARREHFRNVVLVCCDDADRKTFWKVLYCVQSPVFLALTELERVDEYIDLAVRPGQDWSSVAAQRPTYMFKCNFARHATAAMIPGCDDVAVLVLSDLRHVGGTRCETIDVPMPLEEFIDLLPERETGRRHGVREPALKKGKHDDDVKALPWLAELDLKMGFSEGVKEATVTKKIDEGARHHLMIMMMMHWRLTMNYSTQRW